MSTEQSSKVVHNCVPVRLLTWTLSAAALSSLLSLSSLMFSVCCFWRAGQTLWTQHTHIYNIHLQHHIIHSTCDIHSSVSTHFQISFQLRHKRVLHFCENNNQADTHSTSNIQNHIVYYTDYTAMLWWQPFNVSSFILFPLFVRL